MPPAEEPPSRENSVPKPEHDTVLSIDLDPETITRLEKISTRLQCSPNALIRHSLQVGLADLEEGRLRFPEP